MVHWYHPNKKYDPCYFCGKEFSGTYGIGAKTIHVCSSCSKLLRAILRPELGVIA